VTVEDAAAAPPEWAVLSEGYWHDPVPAPDEEGYDASRHSPAALAAMYAAATGSGARAAALAAAGAGAAGAAAAAGPGGAGGAAAAGEVVDMSDGGRGGGGDGGLQDGPEDDSYVEDMPDVPAVDMM
jgi:hypothetical protein